VKPSFPEYPAYTGFFSETFKKNSQIFFKGATLLFSNSVTIILIIFFTSSLKAQIFPDYKERILSNHPDSLFQSYYSMEATEGSVDPDEYYVGPGDKLFISINGIEEIIFSLLINQEGAIYISKVGGIDLKNLTLTQAKDKIKIAINKYYKDVEVFISLVDFRKIKVSLLGNVKKPAAYILPANSRLIDLIVNSYGLSESSNYRNIAVKKRDGKIEKYDLLSFLRSGDRFKNPFLNEGDEVIVDKVDKIVSVYGQIKYPGVYEYLEGETVSELINLAGGFLIRAKKDTIEIVRFTPDGKDQMSLYYSFDQLVSMNVDLNFSDLVLVREMPEYYIDKSIRIDGWIMYPGYYKIIEDKTKLSEIIKEAGGFRKDASLTEATLTRTMGTVEDDPEFERLKLILRADMTDDEYDYLKSKSRQRKGRVVVDFIELFEKNNLSEDLILRRGDIISIPEEKNYITLLGQVVNPGNIYAEFSKSDLCTFPAVNQKKPLMYIKYLSGRKSFRSRNS